MSKTGAGLAAWAGNAYSSGQYVYWYGTYCNKCNNSLLAGKTRQYPEHYGANRQATYKKHIAAGKTATDCVGLIKGYYWELDGVIKYKRNGLPDKGARSMYSAAKIKGKIATLPEIPGVLVWTKTQGHVGVYVGGGYVVEARGFSYGVQRNKIRARGFTHWGLCPYVEYTAGEIKKATLAASGAEMPLESPGKSDEQESAQNGGTATTGNSGANTGIVESKEVYTMGTIRKGSKGTQTKVLQWLLNNAGCDCGEIDGICGTKTVAAIKAYQQKNGLDVDGICGRLTWAALLK